MDPIRVHSGRLAVWPAEHIDTDQIIPARFLTTTVREGLGKACFYDLRHDSSGAERPEFALHQAAHRGASILLAGRNFGCGSSREHAPWALLDYGIKVVIATQIADIFRQNALKNGLLPIVVDSAEALRIARHAGEELQVDLTLAQIRLPDGPPIDFSIDPYARHCLLNGLDEFGDLLSQLPAIDAFELQREAA